MLTRKNRQTDIVIVAAGLGSGGTERVISIIANAWSRDGHVVKIVLFSKQKQPFYIFAPEIKLVHLFEHKHERLRELLFGLTFGNMYRLRRILRHDKPKIVFSFLPQINVATTLATSGLGVKTVISERNYIRHKNISWAWRFLRFLIYRKASLVVINSEQNRELLEKYVEKKKIIYLPNPIISSTPVKTSRSVQKLILAIGRLHEQKGFDILIESFQQSECRNNNWKLLLVGDGPERKSLESILCRLNLRDSVQIIAPSLQVWQTYHDAAVFAMPSRYEGMPNALLEAVDRGLIPVVSEGVGDLAKVIQNVDRNLVAPVGSIIKTRRALDYATLNLGHLQKLESKFMSMIEPFKEVEAMKKWDIVLRQIQ